MNESNAKPAQIALAFAAIYLIWGSTYLGIRFAVETIPPMLMGFTRFVTAGAILYAITSWQGAKRPSARQWRHATVTGSLLIVGGNGGVNWAEQFIPSSVASLIIAIVPLWMVLLQWYESPQNRPMALIWAGVFIGFLGVGTLILVGEGIAGERLHVGGILACVGATVLWASGSFFGRHSDRPSSTLRSVAMQMLTGGFVMGVLGIFLNEPSQFSLGTISGKSMTAWIYLTFIGSLIGYTAYVWLLKVSTPSKISTYAFVNPLIAVALGCSLGNEVFTPAMAGAAGLIIVGVIAILYGNTVTDKRQAKATKLPISAASTSE